VGVALPPSLSPSSVSAFKDCPLAFKFAYLERLPEPPSAPASRGTLVHRALERLMCRAPEARTPDAAHADLATARAELAEHPEFAGLGMTDEEWDAFHAEAAKLVDRYFELEDPTRIRPIGLELKLTAKIGKVTLRGIIDRLEIDADGEWVVTDYKTGSVPSEYKEQARLAGVHIYALLCEQMLGRRPARVRLLYLSKPEMIIARPSEQSVSGVARRTSAIWNAIERACAVDDFRPNPGYLCGHCAFQPYCPAHGGDPAMARELLGPGTVLSPTLPLAGIAS
jgi:putative RecB family exonuclease